MSEEPPFFSRFFLTGFSHGLTLHVGFRADSVREKDIWCFTDALQMLYYWFFTTDDLLLALHVGFRADGVRDKDVRARRRQTLK